MTTTRFGLRSLPTYYKGITFRSRLEARWAMVFDQLNIAWEYEPEGIQIPQSDWFLPFMDQFSYLPDFYLPEFDHYVEVKGHLTDEDYWKMIRIVWELSGGFGNIYEHPNGRPLMVLGNLGTGHHYTKPMFLFNKEGSIYAYLSGEVVYDFWAYPKDWCGWLVGSDSECLSKEEIEIAKELICNNNHSFPIHCDWSRAIRNARSARFDQGHHV